MARYRVALLLCAVLAGCGEDHDASLGAERDAGADHLDASAACFSPTQNVDKVRAGELPGCACDANLGDSPVCIERVGLVCEAGHWISENSPCEDRCAGPASTSRLGCYCGPAGNLRAVCGPAGTLYCWHRIEMLTVDTPCPDDAGVEDAGE